MIFKSGPIRILLGVGLLLFASCGSNAPDEMPANEAGNGKYGGIFRMNFGDGYKSLYPLGATELGSMQILWNVMEGLVAFRGGSPVPEPCLAESWDVLDEATRYVFHIRRGVHFQDDACFPDGKGREVVAQDVAYCLRRLCEADKYNESFWLVDGLIKGAREYHQSTEAADGKVADVEGIKVIDDYTLEIDLTKPFSGLPYLLTSQYTLIYPREAVEKYGIAHLDQKAVGTGPFRVKDVKPGMYVALARNEHYWRKDAEGNALPYLDGIMIGLDKQLNEAAAIRNGKLDLGRNMNMEMAEQFHSHETNGRFRLFQVSTLSSTYLTFLHSYKPFQDERVRKAIALAIDKERIAKHLTNGQQPAKHGVVPPYFEAYETKYVDGIGYDPDEAKRLLAEAGYPGGKGFPEFEFICSERHKAFGLAIQEMLAENLNVSVNVTLLSFQDLVKRAFSGT
ncbi:MAG: ABC transporter substrate-binding protein, partial [Flavobacteriales bacterium]|nr:ABC transporter substrate-binding protein [Flavobacteriales bacterium]